MGFFNFYNWHMLCKVIMSFFILKNLFFIIIKILSKYFQPWPKSSCILDDRITFNVGNSSNVFIYLWATLNTKATSSTSYSLKCISH
jgi:hypothetical protein